MLAFQPLLAEQQQECPSECSSTFPDAVPILTPKDDCCTECYSFDCCGDCYTERHDSRDAEGDDEDIDPRSCEEIWASSCYCMAGR
jgi:hypothetical protein